VRRVISGSAPAARSRAHSSLVRAARPLPQQRRLALIRDADGGDVGGGCAGRGQYFGDGRRLRRPDLARVMLDPARMRKMLRELALRARHECAGAIDQR